MLEFLARKSRYEHYRKLFVLALALSPVLLLALSLSPSSVKGAATANYNTGTRSRRTVSEVQVVTLVADTASTLIFASTAKHVYVSNEGPSAVFVRLDGTVATATNGWKLASGGVWDGMFDTDAISVLSPGGASNVRVMALQ